MIGEVYERVRILIIWLGLSELAWIGYWLLNPDARLLFVGPRSFPRTLPSGSACPKTDPPPASSTGYSPSPTPSTSWPGPLRTAPPVVGLLAHPHLLRHLSHPLSLGHASRSFMMICSALNRFPAILASFLNRKSNIQTGLVLGGKVMVGWL